MQNRGWCHFYPDRLRCFLYCFSFVYTSILQNESHIPKCQGEQIETGGKCARCLKDEITFNQEAQWGKSPLASTSANKKNPTYLPFSWFTKTLHLQQLKSQCCNVLQDSHGISPEQSQWSSNVSLSFVPLELVGNSLSGLLVRSRWHGDFQAYIVSIFVLSLSSEGPLSTVEECSPNVCCFSSASLSSIT